MTEFDKLKNTYKNTVQFGLKANLGYEESKNGNDIIHKFCESLIESSNYSEKEKSEMKHELKILKEIFSKEIKLFYNQ